jgi:hypothetical protein
VEMDQFVKINLIKWLMLSIELTCTLKPRGMHWRMPAHWVGRREVPVVSLTKYYHINNVRHHQWPFHSDFSSLW